MLWFATGRQRKVAAPLFCAPSGAGHSRRALLIGVATLFLRYSRSIVKELGVGTSVAIFRPPIVVQKRGVLRFFFLMYNIYRAHLA